MIAALVLAATVSAADVDRVHAAFDELNAKLVAGHFDTTGKGHKLQTCTVTKSTGDKELDATFCQAEQYCISDNEFATHAFGDCMNKRQYQLLFDLAVKRAGVTAPSGSPTPTGGPNSSS